MTTIFDVIGFVFEWCKDNYYVPIQIGDYTFTFTFLSIMLMPCFVFLTIKVIKGIFELSDL